MFRTNTVFVVGAGASRELNFPLGTALSKLIAASLNFNTKSGGGSSKELVRAGLTCLARHPDHSRNFAELVRKANEISSALVTAPSIDTFIDNHALDPDVALIGKIGIAACLIEAERHSKLAHPRPGELIDLRKVDATWLIPLFHIMAEGVRTNTIEQIFNNVSFIVFNYDRCLQRFLTHAIASRFRLDLSEAAILVLGCNILHPYGSLGSLNLAYDRVDFGQLLHPETIGTGDAIVAMASRLRTLTESQQVEAERIKQRIATAERVVFLGFAFHPQNVRLLQVDQSAVRHVRATVFEMSPSNRNEVLSSIRDIISKPMVGKLDDLVNAECRQFIPHEHLFLGR